MLFSQIDSHRVGAGATALRLAPGSSVPILSVKITLNESIPEERRPQVEALVNVTAGPSDIVWSHSRFPRLVIFVEPGPNDVTEPEGGSIFESPQAGRKSPATLVALLEEKNKACLSAKK